MGKMSNPLFSSYEPDDYAADLMDQAPPYMEKPLTDKERKRLSELERVVTANFQAFYDVGCALREIQQRRLYRETHTTFADYANELWDLARRRAYQIIDAADVVDNVRNFIQTENVYHGTQNLIAPQNERQARELSKYPPEKQVLVWQQAVESLPAGAKMTSRHIKKTAREIGLEQVQAAVREAKKAAREAARINPDFLLAFNKFLDQVAIERANNYKNTDRKELIAHIRVVLQSLESEL